MRKKQRQLEITQKLNSMKKNSIALLFVLMVFNCFGQSIDILKDTTKTSEWAKFKSSDETIVLKLELIDSLGIIFVFQNHQITQVLYYEKNRVVIKKLYKHGKLKSINYFNPKSLHKTIRIKNGGYCEGFKFCNKVVVYIYFNENDMLTSIRWQFNVLPIPINISYELDSWKFKFQTINE